MGLYFVLLLLTFMACQIHINNGGYPLLDREEVLLAAWIPAPFDKKNYEDALKEKKYFQSELGPVSAKDAAKSLEKINLAETEIPEVTIKELKEIFFYIRNTKFVKDLLSKSVERRLTWLYPDEGCECRAELAARAIFQNNMTVPKKVFVFGSPVKAATSNTLRATVDWDYHVGLIYRVGETVYVLDPSLDHKSPLKLEQWNTVLGFYSNDLKYSICAPTTFVEDEPCYQCEVWPHHIVLNAQICLLPEEWKRLRELGRHPETELEASASYDNM